MTHTEDTYMKNEYDVSAPWKAQNLLWENQIQINNEALSFLWYYV